jgi:catechol 2,3-dioxygenase
MKGLAEFLLSEHMHFAATFFVITGLSFMCTLAYVHLNTPNLETMGRFYREQLGLSATFRLDTGKSELVVRSEVTGLSPSESLLFRGHERQIILSQADRPGLREIGLEVFAPRWRQACLILRKFDAVTVEQHPIFKKAMSITDPDGNRIVFGAGSRVHRRVIHKAANENRTLPARLQHFGLGSSRISELAAFYQNKIGFALSDYVTGEDRKLRSTFMRGTEEHHVLALFGNGKPGLDHFSFEAPDWNGIRDWADHFAQFGTKIFWGAGRHGVGNNLFIFVHDPDGNMVEISAELEQVPFGKPAGHWSFDYKAFNLWGPAAIRV